MVALDRSGTVISEPVSRGKISSAAIGRLFKDKIDSEAITYANSCRSFKKCKRTFAYSTYNN